MRVPQTELIRGGRNDFTQPKIISKDVFINHVRGKERSVTSLFEEKLLPNTLSLLLSEHFGILQTLFATKRKNEQNE